MADAQLLKERLCESLKPQPWPSQGSLVWAMHSPAGSQQPLLSSGSEGIPPDSSCWHLFSLPHPSAWGFFEDGSSLATLGEVHLTHGKTHVSLASPSEEVELSPARLSTLQSQVALCGPRWGEYPLSCPLPSFVGRGRKCQMLPARWATLFKDTLTLTLKSLEGG